MHRGKTLNIKSMISGGLALYFLGKVFLNDKRLPKILLS